MNRKIYVFYNNDPNYTDQGGGAEHFRCISRLLKRKDSPHTLVASRFQEREFDNTVYVSETAHFGKYFLGLFKWFFANRGHFEHESVFHFHRNYAAWPKMIFARNVGKTIITYHNTTGKVIEGKLGLLSVPLRAAMVYFEKKVLNYSDQIIFVSDRDRKAMSHIIGNNMNKTIVIPAAFNSSGFTSTRSFGENASGKILAIGRMSHQKNFELTLESFEKAMDKGLNAQLTLAGDGELRDFVLDKVTKSKYKDSINYIGLVPHDKVPALIAEHGIVLVTSRYEASPTIVKETIASKRVIVTTDVGDVNRWVVEGKNGFITKHNADDLSEAILSAQRMIEDNEYSQEVDLEVFSEISIMEQLNSSYIGVK